MVPSSTCCRQERGGGGYSLLGLYLLTNQARLNHLPTHKRGSVPSHFSSHCFECNETVSLVSDSVTNFSFPLFFQIILTQRRAVVAFFGSYCLGSFSGRLASVCCSLKETKYWDGYNFVFPVPLRTAVTALIFPLLQTSKEIIPIVEILLKVRVRVRVLITQVGVMMLYRPETWSSLQWRLMQEVFSNANDFDLFLMIFSSMSLRECKYGLLKTSYLAENVLVLSWGILISKNTNLEFHLFDSLAGMQ